MNNPTETDKATPESPTEETNGRNPGATSRQSAVPPTDGNTIADLPEHRRSPLLMSRFDTALLIVDVQQKLVPHIRRHQLVTWNIRRLIDGARILGVPRLCTEQYPAGLGTTIPELAKLLDVDDEKTRFSCLECKNVARRLTESDIQKVLICGIESHVCVQQSALDFLAAGLDVWIAADAVGSRNRLDHKIALRRMESAGVSLTTTESALFEWCEVSGIPEFKRVSGLVRETPPEVSETASGAVFPKTAARYVLQTDHASTPFGDSQFATNLGFVVRQSVTGEEFQRYEGRIVRSTENPDEIVSSEGITAVDIGSDGTSLNLQNASGQIEMVFLPIGDPRSSHPRWKVRRSERHINSPEYQTDYEITFQVIEYTTDQVYREFQGFEHRNPSGEGCSHVSGVRQVEISSDGRWMVITAVGRPTELMQLPAESHG